MDLSRTLRAPSDGSPGLRYEELLADLGRAAMDARFAVAPNPCVGAAVISEGVEIGRGFHTEWGGPHAEILALEAAAKSGVPPERWDTLVATLEPCSSRGKTPPCTEALREAGIRRVVVGAVDPDPRHRGRSLETLHAEGVEVELLQSASPLATFCPHFLSWTNPDRLRRPRPWLIAKWAQTRTGQLQPPEDVGEGRWISGPSARDEVLALRGRVDAIITGVGTVLADDPHLTVRPPGATDAPPLRVVLDSELRISPHAQLFQVPGGEEAGGPVHVFCRAGAPAPRVRALTAAGAEIHFLRPGDDGRPSLREMATWLWNAGARRVLLESGPILLEAAFQLGFVDQLVVYTGDVNGGRGRSLAQLLSPQGLDQIERREVDGDAVLEAFVRSQA